MSLGARLLNEREIIWKRKGILLNDFVKRNIYPVTLATFVLVSLALYPITSTIFTESAKAYAFLFSAAKEIVSSSAAADVEKVLFSGAKNIRQEEIKEMIKSSMLNGSSIKGLKEDLEESPLIKSVRIRRNIATSTLMVEIKERIWIGAIEKADGTTQGIDSDGGVWDISNSAKLLKSLVIVKNSTSPESFVNLYDYLKYIGINQYLQEAKMVSGRRWNIKMKNGLVVKLPANQWHTALQVLLKLNGTMQLFGENSKVHYVDLRVKNKIFIN